MAFTTVTVTHDFDLPDGSGALGLVEFTPVHVMHNGSESVPAAPIRKVLAAGGVLTQSLKATTDPGTTPPGVPYRIVVRIAGQPTQTYYARVPHTAAPSVDLGSLLTWATGIDNVGGGSLGGGITANPVTLVNVGGVLTPDATKGYGPHCYDATTDVALASPTGGSDGEPLEVQIYASGGDRVLSMDGLDPVSITAGTTWWGRLSYVARRDQWLLDDDSGGGSSGGSSSGGSTGPVAISDVTGLQAVLDGKTPLLASFAARTASRTLTAADAGVEQSYNSTTAGTFTVPSDATASITVGVTIPLSQVGTGQLSVAAAPGVTLQSRGAALKLAGQYAQAELLKVAANTWRVYGDIVP